MSTLIAQRQISGTALRAALLNAGEDVRGLASPWLQGSVTSNQTRRLMPSMDIWQRRLKR